MAIAPRPAMPTLPHSLPIYSPCGVRQILCTHEKMTKAPSFAESDAFWRQARATAPLAAAAPTSAAETRKIDCGYYIIKFPVKELQKYTIKEGGEEKPFLQQYDRFMHEYPKMEDLSPMTVSLNAAAALADMAMEVTTRAVKSLTRFPSLDVMEYTTSFVATIWGREEA